MSKTKNGHRYLQIAEELKQKIQNGHYPIGSSLPTEKDICEGFTVSRYTARSALKHLIDLQLIERRQGSGSVVVATEPPLMQKSVMQDIDDLWQYGNTTRFHIFEQSKIPAPEQMREYEKGSYINLKGLRYMEENNETPFCITEVFVWTDKESLANDMLNSDKPVHPLMSYLCPQNLSRVEQVLKSRCLTKEEAQTLGCDEFEAALCADRKYFDNNNRHIATATNVHAGEHYEYATVLYRKGN